MKNYCTPNKINYGVTNKVMWCKLHAEQKHKIGNGIIEQPPVDPHDCVSSSINVLKYQIFSTYTTGKLLWMIVWYVCVN